MMKMDGYGVYASFYRYGNTNIGVKLYRPNKRGKEDVEKIVERHRIAARLGLAPEPGPIVCMGGVWGYFVERVERVDRDIDGDEWYRMNYEISGSEEGEELRAALRENGFYEEDTDFHLSQLGRKDGRLVFLDFGGLD